MMKTMRVLMLALGLLTAAGAFAAGDVRDGKAYVKPVKNDKFSINGYTMGKVELYGYLGQLRDDGTSPASCSGAAAPTLSVR